MSEPAQPPAASNALVEHLRAGTGEHPLPPPPPPPWYFRRPTRVAAWGLMVLACAWAAWNWNDHRTCEVCGWAFSHDGSPIEGAIVRVEGEDIAAVTDEWGKFHFHHRPRGDTWVLVEVPESGGVATPISPIRGGVIDLDRVYLFIGG